MVRFNSNSILFWRKQRDRKPKGIKGKTGHDGWQTTVFTVLCLSQMGHVLAIRSERESLFGQGLFSNRPLLVAFLLTFGLQMATIYVPQLNPIFRTTPLTLHELVVTLAFSSLVFLAVEVEKFFKRRHDPLAAGIPSVSDK